MSSRRSPSSLRTSITATVPPMAGWRTFPRAVLNLLAFALVALAGTWVVHQIAYRIEYGDRFSAVMAASPHRFYMAPLGLALALAIGALLALSGLVLEAARARRLRLLLGLPRRLLRLSHVPRLHLSAQEVRRTALALATCQVALYLVQENLERALTAQGWPGLAVLLAPRHAAVIPLHLAAAVCGALLLRTVSACLRRSHQADQVARVLAGIVANREARLQRPIPPRRRLPSLRLLAGALCSRSPPLLA